MPVERQQIHRGYLHGILVSGTKPFRYRSGIRTLLSLPSNPDARIAYPLPLPPAGFHYLRGVGLQNAGLQNEVGVEAPRVFRESVTSVTDRPFQRPETAAPLREVSASATQPFERPSLSNTTKPWFETPREPAPLDPKVERETPAPVAEELRIDIPGASQRQVRFPSLTPQPVDEPTMPNALKQVPGVSRNEERRPLALTDKTPTEPPIAHTSKTREAVSPLSRPAREPVVFKRANAVPPQPRTETQSAGAVQRPVAEQREREVTANRSVVPSQAPRVVEMDQTMKAPPMQHAVEAQIAQLRRSASILRRKAVPQESATQESQRPPESDHPERDRPMNQVLPPIVIVNRPQKPRETRPAFWERSYLSRLLRLRPLR